MGEIEEIIGVTGSADLKEALRAASALSRDYARPSGDRSSEEALHQEMNAILDELRRRGEIQP